MGQNIVREGEVIFDLVKRGKITIQNASLNKTILSDDTATFKVVSDSQLDLKINDSVVVYDKTYRINSLPSVNKLNSKQYEYDIQAQGLMYDLLRCKFFNSDGNGVKFDVDFPIIGTIETFLICIVNNMQRFSDKWEVGNFTNGETKTITFGSDNCLSAIQKVCNEFKTDFWVKEESGKFLLHTGAFGNTIPVSFEYGKGKGLYSLSRTNVNDNEIINRLYAFGGSDNIKNGYRDFSTKLKLPSTDYLEDVGLIEKMGLKEGILEFPEIYPKRTGKITVLGDSKFKFIDTTMDFDLNEKEADGITTKYLIAGTSAKVHFNTGNLAGYEFEIKKGGYDHAKKSFEIIPFKNDKDQSFPDKDNAAFQLEVGDEYVILDIVMPDTYVANAENELKDKASEQFALYKQAKVSYQLEVDPEYIRKLSLDSMDIGDYIRVIDGPLGIDKILRINQISRDFIENGERNDYKFKITIADAYEINYNSQLVLDIKDIKNVMSITNLGKINLSRIGVKTTEELKNLIFDTDGYFDTENIRPNSIETNMLTVGSRSQQISCSVVFIVNFEGDKNKVNVNPGVLYSQTFDKSWNIPGFKFTAPDINFRYVYAKCSKGSNSGSIVFTQDKIKFDEDPSFYYFLIGILHSVVEGIRVLSITVGTTTINGGLVRTGVISSLDGSTYFNLENGEIKGNITFNVNSPAFQQVLNHIQIGSRNIMRHSNFENYNQYYNLFGYGLNSTISIENGSIKFVSNENKTTPLPLGLGVQIYNIDFSLLRDQVMTLSYKVKSLNPKKLKPDVFSNQGISAVINVESKDVGNSWEKMSITFRTLDMDYSSFYFYFFCDNGFAVGDTVWLKEPVLEWGNIASDWSPAPEDVKEALDQANTVANNAQVSASNAQTSANTANALLSDIANDDKVTASEKQPLKTEWETIQNEKPIVLAQAGIYNVSTSDYSSAYNELNIYITSTSIFTDLSATTDVNGDSLRFVFSNYYTKKIALLKLISDKAKQLADSAQSSADQASQQALLAQQGVSNVQTSLNDVKTKTDNFISINGGLLMGNILSVGDNQLNQRAFLAGVTDAGTSSIRFAAGANYANKNTAPFRVQDNGKMFALDAVIVGSITATSGTFTGTVNALQGKFGDPTGNKYFTISSNGIETPRGWIVAGDYTSGNGNRKYVSVQGSVGSADPLIDIVNEKDDGFSHTGIKLDVKNGISINVALDIVNGAIRVGGQYGVGTKIRFSDGTSFRYLNFNNGIFVGVTDN